MLMLCVAFGGRAQAAELLSDGGVTLLWPGRCTEPVMVVGRPLRPMPGGIPEEQAASLLQQATAAVRQRCPGSRTMRFDLQRGSRMVPLGVAGAAEAPTVGHQAPAAPTPVIVPAPAVPPAPVAAASRAPGGTLLQPTSTLPSLASAGSRTAQCGVLAQWLESAGLRGAATARRVLQPAEALEAFRDEHLLAVFGKVYDDGDGQWREAVAQSVITPCLQPQTARQPGNLLGLLRGLADGAPPDPNSPEVRRAQEFAPVLRQAFSSQANHQPGLAGPLSPPAITAHVRQVREHYQRANALADRASQAPADLATFRQLDPAGAGPRALGRLTADDRQKLADHLAQRRAALAPALAQAWLATAEGLPSTPEGAATLRAGQRDLADVLPLLPAETRQALGARADALVEAGVAAEVQAQEARLAGTPATADGARSLVAWEAAFNQRFGDFSAAPSVQRALRTLSDTRTQVLLPLLPGWKAQLAAMAPTGAEVAARRAELAALFGPAAGGRGHPLQAEFNAALTAREAAVRQLQAAEEQQRLQTAQRAAAVAVAGPAGAAVMKAGDFNRPAGPAGEALGALFAGDFSRVGIEATSMEMSTLVGAYISGYSRKCKSHLSDPVELMRTVCDRESITYQGRGTIYEREVSRTCVQSHQEPTGVFAERSLHEATQARMSEKMGASMRMVFGMLSGRGGLESMAGMVGNVKTLAEAGQQAAALNTCDSPALARLRVNVENYLRGQPGITLEGITPIGVAMLPTAPGEAYRDSDYARLLDDLVRASAAEWAFNRYQPNSIGGVRVHARDPGGRPLRVEASYRFSGMNRQQQGSVALEFHEGRPACLYFNDAPGTCRPPKPAIASDYIAGKYR